MKSDKFICPISGKICFQKKEIFVTCIDGKFGNFPLCSDCSSKIRQDSVAQEDMSKIKNFINALSKILGNSKSVESIDGDSKKNKAKICPECECSFAEIAKESKMGCSNCLSFFKEEIEIALDIIESNKEHLGKLPTQCFESNNVNYFNEIKRAFNDSHFYLNDLMDEAVSIENYELAAKIRDSIRMLRGCLEKAAFLKEDMHKIEQELNKEDISRDLKLVKQHINSLENNFLELKDIFRISQEIIKEYKNKGRQ